MKDSGQLQKDLARVALGDRSAFARVYQATSAHLFAVALRILNRRDVAEDVLQESFVSVWKHAGGYQASAGEPMTWLISIVRNKALDVVRSAPVRHETPSKLNADGEAADIPDERPTPLQLLTQATDSLAIRGCMEALDASHRQCLALAYYHGMSHSQVAAHMRAPLGSVKAWLRRGLERLKACMENG